MAQPALVATIDNRLGAEAFNEFISKDPFVLKDAVKVSEVFSAHQQKLKFENLERVFLFDQNIDTGEEKMEIAARMIVVSPEFTVRAKDIVFRAPNGYFNFGILQYKCMKSWAPRSYSAVATEFIAGQGSKGFHHS